MYIEHHFHDPLDDLTRLNYIKDSHGKFYAYLSYNHKLQCWIIERREIESELPEHLLPYRFNDYESASKHFTMLYIYIQQNKERFYLLGVNR